MSSLIDFAGSAVVGIGLSFTVPFLIRTTPLSNEAQNGTASGDRSKGLERED